MLGGVAAAAMLAGCGGSQPPVGAPGAMPQSRAIATHAERGGSWMLPEAKSGALLYVSSDATDEVYVFSFPKEKLVGTLTGFEGPEGLCSDSYGDVFVADVVAQDIVEFAHGSSSPIATLSDSGYEPISCSIDSVTGNLAVANQRSSEGGDGNIAIYADAQGLPTFYGDPQMYGLSACGYDNNGNLFIDGYSGSSDFAVLPKGSGTFQSLSISFRDPSSIQWDGQYVAVGGQGRDNGAAIYRLSIDGSKVNVAGVVPLNHGKHHVSLRDFWTGSKKIVATFNSHIGTWQYPSGGSPTKLFAHYTGARGVTLSASQ